MYSARHGVMTARNDLRKTQVDALRMGLEIDTPFGVISTKHANFGGHTSHFVESECSRTLLLMMALQWR
jgi:hypothetical protein